MGLYESFGNPGVEFRQAPRQSRPNRRTGNQEVRCHEGVKYHSPGSAKRHPGFNQGPFQQGFPERDGHVFCFVQAPQF
jgi:hypothetical protein